MIPDSSRDRHAAPRAALVLVAVALAACSDGASGGPVAPGSVPPRALRALPERPIDCTTLTSVCYLPFPTNLAARPADSATGVRVNFREENFPSPLTRQVLDVYPVDLLNEHDGFSPLAPVVAALPEPIDPASLPVDVAASVAPEAAIRFVDLDTLEAVPYWWRIDGRAASGSPPLGLISVFPARPLRGGGTYLALFTDRIRSIHGGAMPPSEGWARLLNGRVEGEAAVVRRAYAPVLSVLPALDEEADRTLLATVYTMRSDQQLTARVRAVRDAVLRRGAERPPDFTLDAVRARGDTLHVTGSYPSPEYRADDDLIALDAAGVPVEQGEARRELLLILPATGAGPFPVAIFGHGLTVAKETMGQVAGELASRGIATLGIDLAAHGSRIAEDGSILEYFRYDRVHHSRDAFIQSVADTMQLTELLFGALADIDVAPGGDGDGLGDLAPGPLLYVGQSLGTVVGGTYIAADPRIDAAVLNVPGGGLVGMLSASPLWQATILRSYVPRGASDVERVALTSLAQALVDEVDPLNFVHHATLEPFDDDPSRPVLLQESIVDLLVDNTATESMVRGLGVPQVGPVLVPIHGVDLAPLPASSGVYQYRVTRNGFANHFLLELDAPARQIGHYASTLFERDVPEIVDP